MGADDAGTRLAPDVRNAFGVPNFRRFFVGQAFSNVGSWFQMLAQSLLVLKLTGSAAQLGAVYAVQYGPLLLVGLWSGAVLDRVDLRKLLVLVSVIAGLQAVALGIATDAGVVNIWWILLLTVPLGVAAVFERSGPQALLPQLVERDKLPSAVAYTNVVVASGRLVGPALGGVLYATVGAAACFYVNAVSYAVVAVSVLLLQRRTMIPRPSNHGKLPTVRDGLRFVKRSKLHRDVLVANFFIGLLAFNFMVVMVAVVTLVFHGGGTAVGAVESLNAAFAVATGIFIARRGTTPTRRRYVVSCFLLGATLGLGAIAPTYAVFLILMPFFGAAAVFHQTSGQAVLQHHTPADMIGRVMSLYVMGNMGTTPIGALIVGLLADATSARAPLALAAGTLIAAGLVLAWLLARREPTEEPALVSVS